MAANLAIAFTVLGVVIWAVAFWWGPSYAYGDVQARYRLVIIAGTGCFLVATVLALAHLAP